MRESVRMRENADQKNSEYVHFSRSVSFLIFNLDYVFAFWACCVSSKVYLHSL